LTVVTQITDDCSCKCCAGEVMVCVLDFKRDVGLWHGVLTVSVGEQQFADVTRSLAKCFVFVVDLSSYSHFKSML